MEEVLPELKKGDVVFKVNSNGRMTKFTVFRVGKGAHFDEPAYYLQGTSGVKLKNPYTGEELAGMGYQLEGSVK